MRIAAAAAGSPAPAQWCSMGGMHASIHPHPTGDGHTESTRLLLGRKTVLRPANREFTLAELEKRFSWSQDEELQYWSGSIPSARTFAEFQRLLPERDWPADGGRRSYAILDHAGCLVGMVSCYGLNWTARTGELGVYIGDRDRWGKGLGSDAVATLLAHLFDDVGLERVQLNTYATNHRALRSYAKVGFEKTAARRRFRPSVGYYREVRMEIDRTRFQGQRPVTSVAGPDPIPHR